MYNTDIAHVQQTSGEHVCFFPEFSTARGKKLVFSLEDK